LTALAGLAIDPDAVFGRYVTAQLLLSASIGESVQVLGVSDPATAAVNVASAVGADFVPVLSVSSATAVHVVSWLTTTVLGVHDTETAIVRSLNDTLARLDHAACTLLPA
jgi:hypothetical protein